MEIVKLELEGVLLLRPKIYEDARGHFCELYRSNLYQNLGIECSFVQDNLSFSKKGTLRGMHFQKSPGQAKLVSVLEGEIFDVVVDIRPESPTYGKWTGLHLNAQRQEQLFIPVGFAHGFCVLSETARVFYKVSSFYNASEEKEFRYDDPTVGIQWPISNPLLSDKDRCAPYLQEVLV